ncbi:MAG TPA: MerR family transcriptional regulator [Polyangiaceae bacterium]
MASRFESTAERGFKRTGLIPIGQFSRVTGLTLKTLRLYHENGLLPPSVVDSASDYRYYGTHEVERARLCRGAEYKNRHPVGGSIARFGLS